MMADIGSETRMRVRVEPGETRCTFFFDRLLLERGSAHFKNADAAMLSPLAQRLFGIEGVESVLIVGSAVTVRRRPDGPPNWQALATALSEAIRDHVDRGLVVVRPEYFDTLPSEDTLRAEVERILETKINPMIAHHGGLITLDSVQLNTVFLQMHGGCQGCAASAATLRQGVELLLRREIPGLGAVLDITDHDSGETPYYPRKTARIHRHAV